jgi:hypothetical protein
MVKILELSSYPENETIIYKEQQNNQIQYNFTYIIEKEGFYPKTPILAYTDCFRIYKIPDNYAIKTFYT